MHIHYSHQTHTPSYHTYPIHTPPLTHSLYHTPTTHTPLCTIHILPLHAPHHTTYILHITYSQSHTHTITTHISYIPPLYHTLTCIPYTIHNTIPNTTLLHTPTICTHIQMPYTIRPAYHLHVYHIYKPTQDIYIPHRHHISHTLKRFLL